MVAVRRVVGEMGAVVQAEWATRLHDRLGGDGVIESQAAIQQLRVGHVRESGRAQIWRPATSEGRERRVRRGEAAGVPGFPIECSSTKSIRSRQATWLQGEARERGVRAVSVGAESGPLGRPASQNRTTEAVDVTVGEELGKRGALLRSRACRFGDVLGGVVPDVHVEVSDVEVAEKHHRLALCLERLHVGTHRRLPRLDAVVEALQLLTRVGHVGSDGGNVGVLRAMATSETCTQRCASRPRLLSLRTVCLRCVRVCVCVCVCVLAHVAR